MASSAWEVRAVKALKRYRAGRPKIGDRDRSTDGRGRVALVTGASSGIGRTMSELLAAKGYDMVVVARREQRLKESQAELESRFGVRIHPVTGDLAAPDGMATLLAELERRELRVDFLVNNAGYDLLGNFLEHPWAEHQKATQLMANGVAELCHGLLPHMVEQGWGRIINVTSIGGFFPGGPTMAMYTASKTFVHKFTEAIDAEYRDAGVHATVSAPGATETELFEVSGVVDFWETNLLPQISMLRPETVARQAYAAVMSGRKVIVHGFPNKVWAVALVHSPKRIRYRLVDFLAAMPDH